MKLTIFLFLITITSVFAQTQADMNQDAHNSYLAADKELNTVYAQIKKEYKDDAPFLEALKNAQLTWIKFRDAEVRMMFPDRNPGYYGTALSMCVSNYMEELTKERTTKLKRWLTPSENDGCSSSIK